MTDTLRVRAYNVRFGDAILVTVPDRDAEGQVITRRILIDVGNVLIGSGGQDQVFQQVMEDILDQLDGQPLDLYVMTHEHLDHIQGLLYAEEKIFAGADDELRTKLNTQFAWLTASADPNYYRNHPDARKKRIMFRRAYRDIGIYLRASRDSIPAAIGTMMLNNNPRKTADCVRYLRELAGHTFYVHRETDLEGKHPFQEAEFEVWAPEEDTSEYYGRFRPLTLGLSQSDERGRRWSMATLDPPPGVDAGAFYNLVQFRRSYFDNLLAIDRAANNSSIVFCLRWRGWQLLFPGDAEVRSWKTMQRAGMLSPVHFLKISHHGSHNGTPDPELLDQVLPTDRPDERTRSALVSTWEDTYHNVPDDATLRLLHDPEPADPTVQQRCDRLVQLHREAEPGGFVELEFEG